MHFIGLAGHAATIPGLQQWNVRQLQHDLVHRRVQLFGTLLSLLVLFIVINARGGAKAAAKPGTAPKD